MSEADRSPECPDGIKRQAQPAAPVAEFIERVAEASRPILASAGEFIERLAAASRAIR